MPIAQGAVEIASSVVNGLKAQPLTLALVIMNLALLGIVWYELQQIFHQQSEVSALLSKCVDAEILKALGLIPKG